MKYVPNMISFMRLMLIIPLMLLVPFELPFMIIYVIAGVSDMIDGPIARKYNATSQFGAALDGGADVLLVLVVVFRIMPVIEISNWVIIWIVIAIIMKLSSTVIGYIRHRQIIFLHTYAGKFFIFMLFLFPVFYLFVEANTLLIILLILAMFVFAEDIYINATSTEADLNEKGILFRDR